MIHSITLVTALNPIVGYEASSSMAKEVLASNRSITDVVLERGLTTEEQLEHYLDPRSLTTPGLRAMLPQLEGG